SKYLLIAAAAISSAVPVAISRYFSSSMASSLSGRVRIRDRGSDERLGGGANHPGKTSNSLQPRTLAYEQLRVQLRLAGDPGCGLVSASYSCVHRPDRTGNQRLSDEQRQQYGTCEHPSYGHHSCQFQHGFALLKFLSFP